MDFDNAKAGIRILIALCREKVSPKAFENQIERVLVVIIDQIHYAESLVRAEKPVAESAQFLRKLKNLNNESIVYLDRCKKEYRRGNLKKVVKILLWLLKQFDQLERTLERASVFSS